MLLLAMRCAVQCKRILTAAAEASIRALGEPTCPADCLDVRYTYMKSKLNSVGDGEVFQ